MEYLGTQNPIFIQKYGEFVLKIRFIDFRKNKNYYEELRNLEHYSEYEANSCIFGIILCVYQCVPKCIHILVKIY